MLCSFLTKKAFFNGASLAVIFIISTKLVSACQAVICDSGLETNTCAIEKNKIAAEWYINLTLAIFVIVVSIYFIQNRKRVFAIISCFSTLLLPVMLRFFSGNEDCGFSATLIAKWSFYLSFLLLLFQIISWIITVKNSKINFG